MPKKAQSPQNDRISSTMICYSHFCYESKTIWRCNMVSRTKAIQGYKPSAFFDFFRAVRRRSTALAASECMRYYLHSLVTNRWYLVMMVLWQQQMHLLLKKLHGAGVPSVFGIINYSSLFSYRWYMVLDSSNLRTADLMQLLFIIAPRPNRKL